jgi:nitrogenase molybdenum-iron protein alpha chain
MVNTKVWKLVTPPWKSDPAAPARPVYMPRARGASDEENVKNWKRANAAGGDEG